MPLLASALIYRRAHISRSRDANVIQAGAVVGGSALSRVLGQALKEGDEPGESRPPFRGGALPLQRGRCLYSAVQCCRGGTFGPKIVRLAGFLTCGTCCTVYSVFCRLAVQAMGAQFYSVFAC